jgi:hypothetical protein
MAARKADAPRFKDIPEDVRRVKLYPFLEAEDLFNVSSTSKRDSVLSKDALEKRRVPALEKKKEQLKKLINQKASNPVRRIERFYRDFPMISVPPDMDAVNDQLGRIGDQIKELKEMRFPEKDLNIITREDWKQTTRENLGRFFRGTREEMEDLLDREYEKYYAEKLAEAEDLLGEQTKDDIRQIEEKLKKEKELERDKGCVASGKSGGGFWDNDDYVKWKKDYDEGNWGKKGYTGSGGWEQMLPFRRMFGLGKSYRELERMGSMSGGQDVQQYFKDKSYWAYPRQNPMVLQGGGVCIAGFCDDEDIVEQELAQAPPQPPPNPLPPPPPASGRLENMFDRANLLSNNVLSNLLYDEARAVSGVNRGLATAVRNPADRYAFYDKTVVYEITPKRVDRVVYDLAGREKTRERLSFRPVDHLDSNNRITSMRDVGSIPNDEREIFWELMRKANRGMTGKIKLTPYDEVKEDDDDEDEEEEKYD